jgi:hypothetical protein
MKRRVAIPNKTKSLLQQEIDSKCPICDSLDVDHFEIHHIDENPENNVQTNLLMLCPVCHSKINKRDISIQEVLVIKQTIILKAKLRRPLQPAKVIKINGVVNNSTIANSIQANKIVINGKKPRLGFADNAIGNDAFKKNYINHLIDRYIKFREYDLGKGKANYAIVHSMIKKEFKASTFQIPVQQFESLSTYLQKRIEGTVLGRINKSKAMKLFSTFLEFCNHQ